MMTTRRLVALAAAGLMVVGAGSAAVGDPAPRTASAERVAERAEAHAATHGGIDGESLRQRLIQGRSEPRKNSSAKALKVTEKESAGAQRVPRPQARHGWDLKVGGSLSTKPVSPTSIAPSREDDGAIPLARDLQLAGKQRAITTTGQIGDGPHGSQGTNKGDYDFYEFRATAGDTLTVDIDPGGALAPQAYFYDATGDLLIGSMDLTGTGDVHLSQPIDRTGTYYVAVGAFRPRDPFVSGSGPIAITEGPYTLDLSLRTRSQSDTDVFAVPLRKGDVLGATVSGSARRIAVHSLDGKLLQSSQVDLGGIYPASSPLPEGGNATTDHVVGKTGIYLVTVNDGRGAYSATLGVRRTDDLPRQTILLDFSGPSFDNRIFIGGVVEPGVREISPMRAFLPRWGLQASDELAVIEGTTRLVKRILRDEIPGSSVRVVNSVTHPDAFGKPGVTRVIIGGTVEEAGLIDAFGVAESIDPGNFAREETAVVMPDRMSSDTDPRSLNRRMTAASNRVQAVSQVVGNTAAHEAGHLLGNFHTDDYDEHTQVMNTGYKLNLLSVGPDGVAGTADDDVLGMRDSRYDPFQGLGGTESTITRTWGASH